MINKSAPFSLRRKAERLHRKSPQKIAVNDANQAAISSLQSEVSHSEVPCMHKKSVAHALCEMLCQPGASPSHIHQVLGVIIFLVSMLSETLSPYKWLMLKMNVLHMLH